MIEREDDLLTSALTLGEVMVKPMETGNADLMQNYEQMIVLDATVVPFDLHAAPKIAEIRQDRSIRTPNAIQLACASAANVDLFIANDNQPTKKMFRGFTPFSRSSTRCCKQPSMSTSDVVGVSLGDSSLPIWLQN